jgi:peroxiredoxin
LNDSSSYATAAEEKFMHPDIVVGNRFPDLELPDHRNQSVKLSELAAGFPLIVSFYRGYW